MPTKELPLHQSTVTDLFTIIYVYVDDYLKAAARSGLFTLPDEPNQKASYAELMTIALVGELLHQPSAQQWFAQVRATYTFLFPSLPDRSRYLRIQLNLERIYADLALRLPHFDDDTVYVIDSKPLVYCVGARHKRPRSMTTATSGRGGHGGYGRTGFFYGFKLHAVIDDHGMLVRFAIVPGREGDPPVARALLDPQEAALVLGDRGYQGCGVYAQPKKNFKKPRHWWGAMRWVRKTIETVFSRLDRSFHLMLPQLNSERSIRAHVCRKIAAHNLGLYFGGC
ncbi:transposase [Deinococcus aquaticus]|uniref:Transposase n=1 Tax=Deinococcus aquaticus TaxID=328692 RepID=A0ABY7UYB6_9DEIO|nr:transposase [Deinococcus aquaticus]WDA57916.1 transposase [Deinococcus aquaticus]